MAAGFARLERQITESRVDVIKWSFLFWTGQCFVMIGFLLLFLRNRELNPIPKRSSLRNLSRSAAVSHIQGQGRWT
jgi:hypothetical protein